MSDTDFAIGVDLGGTTTTAGAVTFGGDELATQRYPTNASGGAEQYVRQLALTIEHLCSDLPQHYTLRGIGIASPAANHREGTIERPANLPWGTTRIVDMLRQYFDLPVTVVNDSNAAALGEMRFGVGKGLDNFVEITLGTGLGAGIVMNGRLLHGASGAAGELGHIVLNPNGRECGCGRLGCVETYVSATGIRRTAFELLASKSVESSIRKLSFNELTSKKLAELATLGDPIAREAFEITGKHLGLLLANIAAVLDPEAFILAGGLMNAGHLLLEPTRKAFEEGALNVYRGRVRILVSALPDGLAAVRGASYMVQSALEERLVL